MKNQLFDRFFYPIVFAIASIVFLITAYNSHGYFYADEHYQIIEFANAKLGFQDPSTLAWEYPARIRPTLQPSICCLVFKGLNALDITNPYTQALCLRLLTALLALATIHFFVQSTKNQFENKSIQNGYCILSYFLWFIPYLNARFSSESWSGLLFLLALAFILKNPVKKSTFFTIGVLLGIGFLLRFQIAFAIIGLFLWLFFINKTKIYSLIIVSLGILLMVVLGICLDTWFYGEFVFAPWNYFYSNIVDDKASSFGVSPWYFYLLKLVSFPSYFVGIPLVLAMIILIIRHPKNIYLWCFVPFLFFHSIIPHKEERFMFSMVYYAPIMMALAYNSLYTFIQKRTITKVINYLLLTLFAVANIVGIAVMSQTGPEKGRIALTKYVYDNYKNRPINIIFVTCSNPYNPWHYSPIQFYYPDNIKSSIHIQNLEELNDSLLIAGYDNLLFVKKPDLEHPNAARFIEENGFIFEKQSVPVWVEKIHKIHDNYSTMWAYTLYKHHSTK